MARSTFLLISFIISASLSAQNLSEALHIFKHSSPDLVARQIASLSSCKLTHNELLQMFDLLDDKSSLKKVGNHSEVRDLAVIIFQELSNIEPSNRDLEVKAIIAFKNRKGQVYRYHLRKLSDKERSDFKTKVQNWLLKKIPA
ncbi:MAG: hypothetical protein NE328_17530 [Lentisphaeraceae bacterium]|nr:hypothetical protein [Lentisphaeraceae bacterium]